MVKAIAYAEERLGDEGRTVVRYSGTEAVLRLMVEARDEALVKEMLEYLEGVAKATLGV